MPVAPTEVARDMKPSYPRRPKLMRGLTDPHGRIRARKDASDSDWHTDSGSNMGASGDDTYYSLPGQNEQGSDDDCDEDEHEEEEEEVNDTLSRTLSRRKS